MNKVLVGAIVFCGSIGQVLAGTTNSVALIRPQIPTLDDIGLTVLTVVVAVAGGIAVRRRKKK